MTISASSALHQLAIFRSQALDFLTDTSDSSSSDSFASVLGAKTGGLSATGRNTSLFDPESAFNMMTKINKYEVDFKSQFAELSQMSSAVEKMEGAGTELVDDVDSGDSNASIKADLQQFVDSYNAWVDRFGPSVAAGGVLDNIQAGEISVYELEQSVSSIFNGAMNGFSGMPDIGVTIDPVTHHASIDAARLDSALAQNKDGVVATIDEFGANLAKSADLLNQSDNFIPRQLDNYSRAIQFISSNRSSLEAEFGTGTAATPSSAQAKALAAYASASAIA